MEKITELPAIWLREPRSQAVDLAAQDPHLLLPLPSPTTQPWTTDLHFLLKVDSSYFLLKKSPV